MAGAAGATGDGSSGPARDRLSPDLVRAWTTGWARARRVEAPVEVDGGLRVRLGLPEREFEYIALDPDATAVTGLATLARSTPSDDWVTVPTTDPDAAARVLTAAGVRLEERREWFMTVALDRHPRFGLPPGYRIAMKVYDDVVYAMIWHGEERAGSGRMALGDVSVADKIETAPTHRRRGLGRALMSALATRALDAGCTTGALVASADGERLYSGLGWTSVARTVIARTPPNVSRG